MPEPLLEGIRRHDRQALSRLLSRLARGEGTDEILGAAGPPAHPARVVAVTGSAGVGKSTLVGRLIEHLRRQATTVAVLACDPQSPLSGGALLGDRFRMPAEPDDGVFIRSLAAPGGQGAIAPHLNPMIRLLESFGFEVIIIETVGAGQGDTVVRDLADVVVVLLQPETGDDLQWEKAGLLEIADVVAVHKGDLPGAERAEAQVRQALGLDEGRALPVLRASAKTGAGIAELWEIVRALPLRRTPAGSDASELLLLARRSLDAWFARASRDDRARLQTIWQEWRQGERDAPATTALLLEFLTTRYVPGQAGQGGSR